MAVKKKKAPRLLPEQIEYSGRAWVEREPQAWEAMKAIAAAARGPLRMRSVMELMRDRGFSMENAVQPYLARRLMREVPGVRISASRSKIDRGHPPVVSVKARNQKTKEPEGLGD